MHEIRRSVPTTRLIKKNGDQESFHWRTINVMGMCTEYMINKLERDWRQIPQEVCRKDTDVYAVGKQTREHTKRRHLRDSSLMDLFSTPTKPNTNRELMR